MNSAPWTPATLGSLAYCLFALQQPGRLEDLYTREEAEAEGLLASAAEAPARPEPDALLHRQNLLGEVSLLNL